MAEANNKVKYGLKNVHYAVATIADDGTATFAAPVAIPGAVNLSLEQQGDVNKFRADNSNYFVSRGNEGYEGDLEMALIPDNFKKDCLGFVEDSSGVLVEDAEAEAAPFALLFEFDGDKHKTRHVMYNCVASRPSVGSQTTEPTIEPVTESMTITSSSVYNAGLAKNVVKASCKEGNTQYSKWFEAVYQPTAKKA